MSTILVLVSLFLVGTLQNFLASLNVKLLQRNKKTFCYIVAATYGIVWCYIAGFGDNLHKLLFIICYVNGLGLGDVLALCFDSYLEKISKSRGLKLKKNKRKKKKT